jgi:hypothetical protein
MSIFKKANVTPIVKTVISQGIEDYIPGDNYESSFKSEPKLSGKFLVLDELDRMNTNVYRSGVHNKEYINGYDEAIRFAMKLVQQHIK